MQFYTLSFCALLSIISFPSSHLHAIKFAYQNVLFSAPTRKPNPISISLVSSSTMELPQPRETTAISTTTTTTANSVDEDSSLEDNVLVVESKNGPEELVRNLLCTDNKTGESPENYIRYDLKKGICAEVGIKGHCGKNMAFKEEIDSPAYGFCDCDFEGNSIPLVYHPKSESCYFVYTQAYCPKGEWLAFNRKAKKAVCEPNKCINIKAEAENQPTQKELARSKLHSDFSDLPRWVPLNGNGTCVQLNVAADNCDQDEEVVFSRYDVFPRCAIPQPLWRSHNILPNPCPIGSYYSIIGRCQPDWDF